MPKLKLSGKELRAIGYPEGPVISIAMNIVEKKFKHKEISWYNSGKHDGSRLYRKRQR